MFWILFAVIAAIGGAGQYAMGMAQLYPPWAAKLARKAYKEHPDLIATTSDLVSMRLKRILAPTQYYDKMAQAGYDNNTAEAIYQTAWQRLTAYDYVALWRRGLIDESTFIQRLSEIGFVGDAVDELRNATLYYPTASDVVTFAVREVYKPDIVAKYGQDQEIDPQYIEAAKQAGLSESFARSYWAAHWQLPSASQGYQMLHYGVLAEDDLRKLLATLDYMPYWRDKLEAISYNPISRVDIRRIFQAGLCDRDKVKQTYLKEGYTPDDAELVTKWVEQTYGPKPADNVAGTDFVLGADKQIYPSAALLIDSYKRGLIGEGDLKTGLMQLQYANETITLIVERVRQDMQQELIDLEANAITDKYRNGAIDLAEHKLELTKIGVASDQIETTIAREMAQAAHRVKMPTKSDYDKWAKLGLIDETTYTANLRILGYRDSDIALYAAELGLQPPDTAAGNQPTAP